MEITAYGNPYPKGRPKVAMRGKYPSVYTPKKTRDAEETLLQQVIRQKPEKPLEGPLKVKICFFKNKPKSYPKKMKHWTQKPDIDNLVKLVLDALNKVFWQDDSQIVELIVTKQFDEVPRTYLKIENYK